MVLPASAMVNEFISEMRKPMKQTLSMMRMEVDRQAGGPTSQPGHQTTVCLESFPLFRGERREPHAQKYAPY
jgi:hypothetical protein